jgi:diguanylate cyclase (GGDEF)-like protein
MDVKSPGRVRSAISRLPFLVRWVLTVTLSLIGAGLVGYAVSSHQMEQLALEAMIGSYESEIVGLESVLASDLAPDAQRVARAAELDHIAATYGTEYVGLFDATGRPVLVTDATPTTIEAARFADVLATGIPSAKPERDSDHAGQPDHYEFILPVRSPDGMLVILIAQRTDIVGNMLSDLRRSQLLATLLGLAVAIPLSYLLGGHALIRQHRRAQRNANTDALTGIAARRPFRPALEAALAGSSTENMVLGLIDIDDFKQVNDRLGHTYGDRVLCALADSFDVLRASDTAYRLGGDEFAVVLTSSTDEQAHEALKRVRQALTERAPGITFSAGLASAQPRGAVTAQELWERADAALYAAKARGHRHTVSFDALSAGLTVSPAKIEATSSLLKHDGGLSVAFQPIWDLRSGQIIGHEALIRLPLHAPIDGPQEAFELAERLGLAADLDACARRAILSSVRARKWAGLLFINIHPDALERLDADALVAEVASAGLAPSDVILAVTEHASLDHPESIRSLEQAHARGFRLALDDMGKGNAGLRTLTHVQFDVVKIDSDVIAHLGVGPASDATVAAAVAFVQRTGGLVVAKGIEDAQRLRAVLGIGHGPVPATAIAGQGHFLGRPAPTPTPITMHLNLNLDLDLPYPHTPLPTSTASNNG